MSPLPQPLVLDFGSLVQNLSSLTTNPPLDNVERGTCLLGHASAELVSSSIDEVGQTLAVISSMRQQVTALLSFLDFQQGRFEDRQARYRSLLAPIGKLPVEVLQDIFLFAQEDEGHKRHRPPVVAQVNYCWRSVALATPRLWSTIALPFGPHNVQDRIEELKLRMARSVGQRVSLTVRWTPAAGQTFSHVEMGAAGTALAQEMIPYTPRLGTLIINIYREPACAAFLEACKTSPALDLADLKELDLELDFLDEPERPIWLAIQTLCSKAPTLEKLFLPEFDNKGVPIPVPLKTLKAFSGVLNSTNAPLLKSTSPSPLELLDLILPDGQFPLPGPRCPSLANLTTLIIRHTLASPPARGFPPLPALAHLILGPTFRSSSDDGIPDMLRAWGTNLRYLSLPMVGLNHLIEVCLSLTPRLECLRVECPDDLQEWVSAVDHTQLVVPSRLAHFEIEIKYPDSEWFTAEVLCSRMIYGSIPHVSTLTFLVDFDTCGFELIQQEVRISKQDPRYSQWGMTLHLVNRRACGIFDTPYLKQTGISERWYNSPSS